MIIIAGLLLVWAFVVVANLKTMLRTLIGLLGILLPSLVIVIYTYETMKCVNVGGLHATACGFAGLILVPTMAILALALIHFCYK